MDQIKIRIVICIGILLAILFVIYIEYSGRNITILSNERDPHPISTQTDTRTLNVNFQLGRWDHKHLYKLFDFVLVGDQFTEISSKYNICLATQSSFERLHSIVEVSNHWVGSISLSIFIAGNEFSLVEFYISYLRKCFPQIREHVSFHLVFSSDHPPTDDHFNSIVNQDCDNPEIVLKEVVQHRTQKTTEWRQKSMYPQNILRNQARKNCQSSYVFVTDIDIIPSYGIVENIDLFLKTVHCEKLCAYVIPVYEIHGNVSFPKNKPDIIELHKGQLARPFHEKVYNIAQWSTDYERWEGSVIDESETVHISHTVQQQYKDWYEPFTIVLNNAPLYDERFIGYGYTRNTQAYEMKAAGYQFQVLSPVFACHWHLQTSERDYNPWRRQQLLKNTKKVAKFKYEIRARYSPYM